MVFNSTLFVLFLLVVLLLYYGVPWSWAWRKAMLLVMSVCFYAAWRVEYVLLILFSTCVDWFLSQRIASAVSSRARRGFLILSLASNLGLLAFFKYSNFFRENVNVLSELMTGAPTFSERFDILLPVGISFYTFQTLSYTIDIYRGTMKPWRSFLDFSLYVTFFPQLVAGPIVRAVDFGPQCERPPARSWGKLCWGFALAVLGMFQKVVLSDALLAPQVDTVYQSTHAPGALDAWVGTLAFSGQIYFDFAGYSICAIGVAMMLGFELPDNFHAPYAARGFSDFWRRWHISLSSWLRDYLYISLGGNRRGPTRTQVNLFLTMLLGGLWHGASWNFVLWGALHGTYLIGERQLRPQLARVSWLRGRFGSALGWAVTYLLVCIAWVPFRASDWAMTRAILRGMFGLQEGSLLDVKHALVALGVVAAMLIMQRIGRDEKGEALFGRLPWWLGALVIAVMIFLTLTNIGTGRAFIYFQF